MRPSKSFYRGFERPGDDQRRHPHDPAGRPLHRPQHLGQQERVLPDRRQPDGRLDLDRWPDRPRRHGLHAVAAPGRAQRPRHRTGARRGGGRMATRITRDRPPPAPQCWGEQRVGSARRFAANPGVWAYATPPALGGGGGRRAILTILLILVLAAACCPRARGPMRWMTRCARSPSSCAVRFVPGRRWLIPTRKSRCRFAASSGRSWRQGETPDQIKAYFVARYGEGILVTPDERLHARRLGHAGSRAGRRVGHRPGSACGAGYVAAWRSLSTPAVPAPRTADDERLERELAGFRRERARRGGWRMSVPVLIGLVVAV